MRHLFLALMLGTRSIMTPSQTGNTSLNPSSNSSNGVHTQVDTVVRTVNTDDVSASGECIDPVIGMMNAPGAAGIAWRMTTEDRATAMSPFAIGGGRSSACTEHDEPASG